MLRYWLGRVRNFGRLPNTTQTSLPTRLRHIMASAQPPNQLAPAIDQAAAQSPTASTSTAAPAGDGPKAYPPSATALLMVENPSLSRSAAKKLLREQAWIAGKADRRAKERERNKAKAAEKRKLVEDGVIERPAKRGRLPAKRAIYGARVVIDLGFDDLMIDKVSACWTGCAPRGARAALGCDGARACGRGWWADGFAGLFLPLEFHRK